MQGWVRDLVCIFLEVVGRPRSINRRNGRPYSSDLKRPRHVVGMVVIGRCFGRADHNGSTGKKDGPMFGCCQAKRPCVHFETRPTHSSHSGR
jgi:hypothetical protein